MRGSMGHGLQNRATRSRGIRIREICLPWSRNMKPQPTPKSSSFRIRSNLAAKRVWEALGRHSTQRDKPWTARPTSRAAATTRLVRVAISTLAIVHSSKTSTLEPLLNSWRRSIIGKTRIPCLWYNRYRTSSMIMPLPWTSRCLGLQTFIWVSFIKSKKYYRRSSTWRRGLLRLFIILCKNSSRKMCTYRTWILRWQTSMKHLSRSRNKLSFFLSRRSAMPRRQNSRIISIPSRHLEPRILR